ncbi:MAG: molecular chaperone DnaJ, partial [Synechococcus sp.]
MSGDGTQSRKITITVSSQLVELIDQLKAEWGLRARGAVVERLVEELLPDPDDIPSISDELQDDQDGDLSPSAEDTTSLVLISRGDAPSVEPGSDQLHAAHNETSPSTGLGIDLPGFVRRRTSEIKETLQASAKPSREPVDLPVSTVPAEDLSAAVAAAETHWRSLYGNAPGDTVVEAAMA